MVIVIVTLCLKRHTISYNVFIQIKNYQVAKMENGSIMIVIDHSVLFHHVIVQYNLIDNMFSNVVTNFQFYLSISLISTHTFNRIDEPLASFLHTL